MPLPWQTPGFSGDPYAAYHQFGAAPVHADDHTWILSRPADIIAVLKDARFGFHAPLLPAAGEPAAPAADPTQAGKLRRVLERGAHLRSLWLGTTNPPNHTRLRAALAAPFSPAGVARLRPNIQAAADELLDRVQNAGEMDVIADLADPLPLRVMGDLLGLPPSDAGRLKAWAAEAAPMMDHPDKPVVRQRGLLAIAAFAEYLQPVIAQRQREPQDDLISQLLASPAEDRLSPDELVANCIAVFFGGQDTTSATIGNLLLALLRHPDQLRRLRDEPALIVSAVEELLRYDSPAQFVARSAFADVALNGCPIQKDQQLMLLLGAANHDPALFAEPDQLALDRSPNPHLVFGYGSHFCLGAHLVRLEAQIMISTVIQRLPRLALQDRPLQWRPGLRLRALKFLPVRF